MNKPQNYFENMLRCYFKFRTFFWLWALLALSYYIPIYLTELYLKHIKLKFKNAKCGSLNREQQFSIYTPNNKTLNLELFERPKQAPAAFAFSIITAPIINAIEVNNKIKKKDIIKILKFIQNILSLLLIGFYYFSHFHKYIYSASSRSKILY